MFIEEAWLAAAHLSGAVSSSLMHDAALATARHVDPDPSSILDYGSGEGQLLPLLASNFPAAALHARPLGPIAVLRAPACRSAAHPLLDGRTDGVMRLGFE